MKPFDIDSDTSVESFDLSEGAVSLKGTTHSGKGYELTGDVSEANIVVSRAESQFYDKYLPVSEDTTYWLKFKIRENTDGVMEAYRVQLDTVDVERTARILADDRTAAAIEAARVRVGAPEKAKVRFGDFMRNDGELRVLAVDEPNPIMLEFYWTEKVVK